MAFKPDSPESHGQIQGIAPAFGPDGGEIMAVQDNRDGTVTIFTEDFITPQQLNPTTMTREDYLDLLQNQPE